MSTKLPSARDLAIRQALGWPSSAVAANPSVATSHGEEPRVRATPRETTILVDRLLLLPIIAFILLLGGCERPRGIVLWHAYNDAERAALETTAARWNAEHGDQPIELVAVPYGAFADKITSAIPGGNGPDLFIYPQDRIGDWADSGVIEPIEFWVDDARADRFTEQALGAMAYKGSLWGLPMTVKSLVLYYRTDLAPEPPRTTDELIALEDKLRDRHVFAVAYPNPDLYAHAVWLHGFGGWLFAHSGSHYISPDTFSFDQSVMFLAMAVLGGNGSAVGSIVGASLLTLVPEILRFLKDRL